MGAVDIFIGEAILIIKMFVIILSSLLAASNSLPFQFSSLSKPSVRVPNPCNTQEGTQCVSPFTYLGVEYYKCTYAASPVPWCATMVDSNGTVVTNKWGDCSNTALSSCPVESIDVPSCVTQGGPQENMPCVFPFRHLGITYTSCTTIGKDMAWCSTNTTSGGEHVDGNYGYCPASCPGAENNTSTTTGSSTTTTTASSTTPSTTTTTTVPTTTTASTTTTTASTTTTTTPTTGSTRQIANRDS